MRSIRLADESQTPDTLPAAGTLTTGHLMAPLEEGRWRARVGGRECTVVVDGAVDPALLEETHAAAGRVLIEEGAPPVILGVVTTSRGLTIDREGNVLAQLERLAIAVRGEAVIRDGRAFMRIKAGEVELYGQRVITRAREVAKILARMISLN